MKVESIHRWQWMLSGLIIGLLCGWLRDVNSNFADELATYGRRIGQRDFERGIVNKFHGRAQFSDIVVHPYRLSGSSSGAAHVDVVEGLYFDGQTQIENGKLAARWEPAYFVASMPYRPVTTSNGGAIAVRPAAAPSFDDVASYLASLPQTAGVQFRYDSLAWLTRPIFIWTAGGFVLVGLIWPTIVNLLVFGSIRRPREERVSLQGVKGTSPQAKPVAAPIELEAVAALDQELDQVLSDQLAPATSTAPAAPARKLDAEPITAAAAAAGPQGLRRRCRRLLPHRTRRRAAPIHPQVAPQALAATFFLLQLRSRQMYDPTSHDLISHQFQAARVDHHLARRRPIRGRVYLLHLLWHAARAIWQQPSAVQSAA